MFFVWDDWNEEHIARHGVEPFEAEHVVLTARRPYPRRSGPDKFLVKGTTVAGRWLQVIYVLRPADKIPIDTIDPTDLPAPEAGEPAVYVIHARDLKPRER